MKEGAVVRESRRISTEFIHDTTMAIPVLFPAGPPLHVDSCDYRSDRSRQGLLPGVVGEMTAYGSRARRGPTSNPNAPPPSAEAHTHPTHEPTMVPCPTKSNRVQPSRRSDHSPAHTHHHPASRHRQHPLAARSFKAVATNRYVSASIPAECTTPISQTHTVALPRGVGPSNAPRHAAIPGPQIRAPHGFA